MIKGAIFDLDGTLIDSMFIWDTIGEDYLKSVLDETDCAGKFDFVYHITKERIVDIYLVNSITHIVIFFNL